MGQSGVRLQDARYLLLVCGMITCLQACCRPPRSRGEANGWQNARDEASDNLAAVLFLDVDGVLHPYHTSGHIEMQFERRCMEYLREILQTTKATIVLSSAWRETEHSRQRLRLKLREHGLPTFASVTRILPGNQRPREIIEWVAAHKPVTWVAVDDMPLHQDQRMKGHFVQTRALNGLQRDTASRIIECFEMQARRSHRPPS